MPYLVEELSASNIEVEYDASLEELSFQVDVTIGKGDPSDQCPEGFLLDRSGMYCLGIFRLEIFYFKKIKLNFELKIKSSFLAWKLVSTLYKSYSVQDDIET